MTVGSALGKDVRTDVLLLPGHAWMCVTLASGVHDQ